MELPENEEILASAVSFLATGQEQEAAATLLASSLVACDGGETWYFGSKLHYGIDIHLTGPRRVYEIMSDDKNPIKQAIEKAVNAVLPQCTYISSFTVSAENVAVNPGWRSEFLEYLMDVNVSNQGPDDATIKWNTLRFRSQSEVKIAEALDEFGVLFLPNCKARLNTPEGRRNREADFIVCHNGKWGIIEVDGEPYHPPTRSAEEHKRDRYFKEHGIFLVERFDATDCYNNPKEVVRKFLRLLENT